MNTRKQFFNSLIKQAKTNNRLILIVGDVGFSYVEEFRDKFPNQFINVGIMEQTMIGVAAGMHDMGWKPYVYTAEPFYFRCFEQIRNELVHMKRDVNLIGVASESYKFLGFTHSLTKDEQKIMDAIPQYTRL